MKIRHFTDLEAWQEAHKLTLLVYKITAKFPKSELYGLTSQLRRAVVSIESCIAEGFCRFHYKDRLNFYYDARGSVGEIESQIIDAPDLKFIKEKDFQLVWEQAEKAGVILGGLIRGTQKLSKK
jgi:four helix bundle protein